MTGWLLLPFDIPVGLDRDEARRRAVEELAKAKYGGRPGWVEGALDRVVRLVEKLLELYDRLFGGPRTGGGISWGFVIAVALLLAALALVVWRVGLPRWRATRPDGTVQLDAATPAADYRALAQHAADRGDWAAAVRDRFRAVVRELETRTVLEVRPARTAWEAAYSAVRTVPGSQPALFAGADLFNRVVYGDQAADQTAYAQMVAIDAAVMEATDRVDLAAGTEPAGAR